MSQRYAGQRAVLLTQHGKELLMAPILRDAVGCQLERASGFDTDTLGTFARDIPRQGSQLLAARRKARIAIELSGCRIGLGSEGSFVPDPYTGFMPWNIETVVWLDDDAGLEVCGVAQGPARHVQRLLHDTDSLAPLALEAGFPEHGLMLRPNHEHDPQVVKGLQDEHHLRKAFEWARNTAHNGAVFVESDLRAHLNPTRQKVIQQATANLADKLNSPCPRCFKPGFWASGVRDFCPCEVCARPTRLARTAIWRCVHCGQEEDRPIPQRGRASAAVCDSCNP